MPDAPRQEDDPRRQRIELAAAVVLGLAALAAAWTAYQAALTDGDAAQGYTLANSELSDANFFYARGHQQASADNQLFLTFLEAEFQGDSDLAAYIRDVVMSENLREAVAFWEESDEALTPFDPLDDNPYVIDDFTVADEHQEASEEAFAEGADADETGDTYELAGVLLAVALFVAGISTLFKRDVLSWSLVGLGALALAGGAAMALTA